MSSARLEEVHAQLNEVQQELDNSVKDLVETIKTVHASNEGSAEQEIRSQRQILDELWVIKSAMQELESLESLGELDTALLNLQKCTARVEKFAAEHPTALLTADFERRLNDMGKGIRQRLQSEWNKSVFVTKSDATFEIRLALDPGLFETANLYMPNLVEEFIVSLSPVFDAVINLEVREVFEDENSVELGRTKDQLDVITMIDVVQTLVLALGGVLAKVPDLQARIARRYGHYLIENFVHKSFPGLFPENAERLDVFKKDVEGLRGLEDVMTTEGWTKGRELSLFANSFESQWTLNRQNHYLSRLRTAISGEYKVDSWDWDGEDVDDDGEDGFDDDASIPREKALDIFHEYAWELDTDADYLLAIFRALAPKYYRNYPMLLYVESLRLLAEASSLQLGQNAIETTENFANHVLAGVLADNASAMDRYLYAVKVSDPYNPGTVDQIMKEVDKVAQSSGEAGPQIREHVISQTVEQIVTFLIRSVEAMEDISEVESFNIATNINAFRGCSAYFENILVSVPSWVKLQRLETIVQGRLDDIAQMTASGMLSDFSAAELEGLITALFVDSDHRQQVLDLVVRVCV